MSIYVLIAAIATTPATGVTIVNVPPPVTINPSSPSGRPPKGKKSNPIPKETSRTSGHSIKTTVELEDVQ